MTTISRSKIQIEKSSLEKPSPSLANRAGRLARGVGVLLLRILAGILVLLTVLPVAVLSFITSVPLPLTFLLVLADVALIAALLRRARTPLAKTATLAGFVAVAVVAVGLSQVFASTPAIVDAGGDPLPNSIATMETVELNGSQQWITVRGNDVDNPVLLFLAGGPGGSELPSTRMHLSALEEHFVVVNWDQPGAAKSYGAVDISTLTPERYVADGHALVQHLRARFDEDKVYLLGESWGTILGTWLVRDYPELFHAYVGSGQMVNTTENDVLGYEFALQLLSERGDTSAIERLRRNGPPPYTEGNLSLTYASYLGVLNDYMAARESGQDVDILIDAIRESEYGLLDKVNWVRGLMDVFNAVYPQLADVDLATQAAELQVPVYMILGRHDVNAMTSLAEDYFSVLDAPHKELIWFEKSGHPPLFSEADKLVDLLVNRVLPQTYPEEQPAPASATAATDTDDFEAFFDDLIPQQLRENHLVGATVAVVQDGQTAFAKGYGYADLNERVPVSADRTLFFIGSDGKLFTWTAVMQLAEQGKLDLHTDVNTYLDFAVPATFPEPITLHHLMTHTAGFEEQLAAVLAEPQDVLPLRDFLLRYMPERVYAPGTYFAYSNYGTALAGYIVQRVSGEPYEQYVATHILEPLGMARSAAVQPLPPDLAGDLSEGYHYQNGAYDAKDFEWVAAAPAAAIHTTATDVAKFMIAHLEQGSYGDARILEAATVDEMHRRHFTPDPRLSGGMAYGFPISFFNDQRVLWHMGESARFTTLIALLPDQRTGLMVSYNTPFDAETTLHTFLDRYYPAPEAPAAPPPTSVEDDLARYAGTYISSSIAHTSPQKFVTWLRTADVTVNGGGMLEVMGHPYTEIERGFFQQADGDRRLTFEADGQGEVTHLFIGPFAYFKLAWYQTLPFHLALLALSGVLFLSAVVGFPIAAMVRRRRGDDAPSRGARVARWLGAGTGVFNLALLTWFVLSQLGFAETYIFPIATVSTITRLWLLSVPLTLGLVVLAVVAWKDRYWGRASRVHYTLIALGAGVFVWWLNYWNLLGFQF